MGDRRGATAEVGARAPRPLRTAPGVLVACLAVAVLPTLPLAVRGLLAVTQYLTVVLQTDEDILFGVLLVVMSLPRVLASLWIYFRAWNGWANEVALMALFLLSPVLGIIVWVAARDSITRPPRGLEHARIVDGKAVVPIYEPVYDAGPAAPAPPTMQAGPAYPPTGAPYQPPAQPYPQPYTPPYPQPPAQPYPQPPAQPYAQPYPLPYTQPYAQPYPQPYPPPYPPPGSQPYPLPYSQPYPPVYPQPYSQPAPSPYPPPYGPPSAYPPYQGAWGWPAPQVQYRQVGETVQQKRDVLAWHGVILLLFDAYMLASWLFLVLMSPLLVSRGTDWLFMTGTQSTLYSPGFVLVSLIVQDGILVALFWHQLIKRGVLTLGDLGLTRTALIEGGRWGRLVAVGLVGGLLLVGASVLIELGQSATGFEPTDTEGPSSGDLPGYLMWLVSGCLIAPVSEELFFRGYAFHAFKLKYGLAAGVAASAVFFSAIHLNAWGFLPIIVAGAGLALIYHWTRSLVPAMVAHAVNNFIALTIAYMGVG